MQQCKQRAVVTTAVAAGQRLPTRLAEATIVAIIVAAFVSAARQARVPSFAYCAKRGKILHGD